MIVGRGGGKGTKRKTKRETEKEKYCTAISSRRRTRKTETDCISPLPADKKRVRKEGCVLAHGRGYSPSQWQRYSGRGMRPLVISRPQSEGREMSAGSQLPFLFICDLRGGKLPPLPVWIFFSV